MTDNVQLAFAITAYRVISLLVGLGIVYLGFRLFSMGVFEKAGELKATWGNKHLGLRSAAPGTFFALFGTVIVSISLYKGLRFEAESKGVPQLPIIVTMQNPSKADKGAEQTASKSNDVSNPSKAPVLNVNTAQSPNPGVTSSKNDKDLSANQPIETNQTADATTYEEVVEKLKKGQSITPNEYVLIVQHQQSLQSKGSNPNDLDNRMIFIGGPPPKGFRQQP